MVLQRRQSFATTSSSRPRGIGKKRSHSLAPGDAQRLAPRKSILKASTNTISQSSSQEINNDTSEFLADRAAEYTEDLHDNDTRKSLGGRRVSFAPLAQYRMFDIEQNTNSSGAPSSSPPASPPEGILSPPEAGPLPAPRLSNENDYPGRRPSVGFKPRFSTAYSENGEASMSMDIDDGNSDPPNYLPSAGQSGSLISESPGAQFDFEGDTEEDEEDDEDMEITEAISLRIDRKRSLSIAAARRSSIKPARRSSVKQAAPPAAEGDVSTESAGSGDASVEEGESSSNMDFTIPLEKPIRPRAESDAWLALQAMTHSAEQENNPGQGEEGSEMDLTNALSRLRKARASFDFAPPEGDADYLLTDTAPPTANDDASFTSTDISNDSVDAGDRTMNYTSLLGGVRNLDITEGTGDTGNLADIAQRIRVASEDEGPSRAQPAPSARPAVSLMPNVFSAPSSTSPAPKSPQPAVLSFASPKAGPSATIRPASSTPTRARPQNQGAKENDRHASSMAQSQLRPASAIPVFSGMASPAKKRPSSELEPDEESDMPKPSPSKKRALGVEPPPEKSRASPLSSSTNTQLPAAAIPAPPPPSIPLPKSNSSIRRPSGYFAQRRSLLPGALNASTSAGANSSSRQGLTTSQTSPIKALPRRASMAAVPASTQARSQTGGPSALPTSLSVPSMPSPIIPSIRVRSPSLAAMDGRQDEEADIDHTEHTERWRESVADDGGQEENMEDFPAISIAEFFMMTGVKFMDELTIPRRSIIRPSQMRAENGDTDRLPTMADYVTAMSVDVPQLELYAWVSKDLQTWIENGKKIYREAEEEVAKVTPGMFREFTQADEEGRAELLHQLKLIKANKHTSAKEKWYEWKYQWMENLLETAEKALVDLEADNNILSSIVGEAEGFLPALRQQHSQILLELEQERAEVEEMEHSDPAYLEELKATINEQNALLEGYVADVAEGHAKLERLHEKLSELDAQRQESNQAIADADRKIKLYKNSTRVEVFRLKDELEAIQAIHSWKITKVQHQLLELVYDNRFRVIVPCKKYSPICSGIRITRVEDVKAKSTDLIPLYSEVVLQAAQQRIAKSKACNSRDIVESLSDFWTSCSQIRSQLNFLAVKYPLSIEVLPAGASYKFKAVASLLFHRHKAKALVSFAFDEDLLARWPFAIRSMPCDVKVAYGAIDHEVVRNAVMGRLSQATAEDNHACLLDACVEATARYEEA